MSDQPLHGAIGAAGTARRSLFELASMLVELARDFGVAPMSRLGEGLYWRPFVACNGRDLDGGTQWRVMMIGMIETVSLGLG
jgi:hypothetical protein